MNLKMLVIGSCVVDLSYSVKELPRPGQTTLGTLDIGAGGKGFNQAFAAARVLEGFTADERDSTVTFIGPVGEDPESMLGPGPDSLGLIFDEFIEQRNQVNLEAHLLTMKGHRTGSASIVTDSTSQNQIVVDLGANLYLTYREVETTKNLRDFSLLQLKLELAPELTLNILKEAKSNGIKVVILNPAPADTFETKMLVYVDILTPNQTEFKAVMDKTLEIQPYMHYLVTLGDKGVAHVYRHDWGLPPEVNFSPSYKVDAVDSAGAGDAFNGALAATLHKLSYNNLDSQLVQEAAEIAQAYAALSVTKVGTSKSYATNSELQEFLGSQNKEGFTKITLQDLMEMI